MRAKTRRNATTAEAFFAIFCMLLIVGGGSGILGWDLKTMLVIVNTVFLLLALRCGVSWREIEQAMAKKVASMSSLYIILLGIGFLIASLFISGTVPAVVAYMASSVSPKYCVVLAFVLTSVVSLITGSSFCTMGTIGVMMFGVAMIQGIHPGIAAAAVICGSWLGNYSSPVSDIINCVALEFDMVPSDLFAAVLKPYGITAVLSAVWFWLIGTVNTPVDPTALEKVNRFVQEVEAHFFVHPVLILPVLLVIVLSVKKVPTILLLFGSGLVSLVMGIVLQGYSVNNVCAALFEGFSSERFFPGMMFSDEFLTMVNRGGMLSMGDSIIFLILILSALGILETIGVFGVIDRTVFRRADHPVRLTFLSLGIMLLFGAVTGNDFATVMISRDVFDEPYRRAGRDLKEAAILTLTGVITSTMCLPWSFCADYSASIYGVRVLDYVPYCSWFLLLPFVTLAFLLVGMRKAPQR